MKARQRSTPHWFRRVRKIWRNGKWPLIAAVFVIAFALGICGFAQHSVETGTNHSAADLFYLCLQLFVLNSGAVDGQVPWCLQLARFLAPAVMAYAAIEALVAILHEQFQLFWLRFRYRNHVIICGLGRKGFQLAQDFLTAGERVVIVEADDENDWIASCRDLGGIVLLGSSTDRIILQKARVEEARCLFSLCGSDGTNIDTAVCAYRLIQASPRPAARVLKCFIHIADASLCVLFKNHPIFSAAGDPFEARVFNVCENSARLFLAEYPLDRDLITVSDPRTVHLVVIGFGCMGEGIALQAAKLGHYANGKKLRLTVICRNAEQRARAFYAHYPRFREICETTFVQADVKDPSVLEQLVAWAGEKSSLLSVAVCFDNDSSSLACALWLSYQLQEHRIPIIARVSEDAGLAELLRTKPPREEWARHVCIFGLTSRACSSQAILTEEIDCLARAIHEDYVQKRLGEGASPLEPSLAPWEQLDEGLKDSNRQQADHIPVKLRAVKCEQRRPEEAEPDSRPYEFTDDDIELLARMEHLRWCAERILTGWSLGPKDVQRKQTPYLVSWDDPALPENIKEYDRQAVRNIPRWLELFGEGIYNIHGSISDAILSRVSEGAPRKGGNM